MGGVPFRDGVHHSSGRPGCSPDAKWEGVMGKAPKRSGRRAVKGPIASTPAAADFDTVVGLIDAARRRAFQAVNTALIDLYWAVGEHISGRVASASWGQGTVQALAEHIY